MTETLGQINELSECAVQRIGLFVDVLAETGSRGHGGIVESRQRQRQP
jgi:hypothetical protein